MVETDALNELPFADLMARYGEAPLLPQTSARSALHSWCSGNTLGAICLD